MRYGIKSVRLALIGEGALAGTKAVVVSFTGCNLWDGNPLRRDAGPGACAAWCDADFEKGTTRDEDELLAEMNALWPDAGPRWVMLTGGEPCVQLTEDLMRTLLDAGWRVAIETNGAEENDAASDASHIVWSPKLDSRGEPFPLAIPVVHEVRVVLPGDAPGRTGWTKVQLLGLALAARDLWPGVPLFVQPQDPIFSSDLVAATMLVHKGTPSPNASEYMERLFDASHQQCIAWVLANPTWRLTLQQQKLWGSVPQ